MEAHNVYGLSVKIVAFKGKKEVLRKNENTVRIKLGTALNFSSCLLTFITHFINYELLS